MSLRVDHTLQESQVLDIKTVPADVLRYIGFFCDSGTRASLVQTCRHIHEALAETDYNKSRNTANTNDSRLIFSHHLSRHNLPEIRRMLLAARKAGTLAALLNSSLNISHSPGQLLQGIKALPYALWSLNKALFDLLREFVPNGDEQIREFIENTSFTEKHGKYADLSARRAWSELNQVVAGIKNWKLFSTGSDDDIKLKAAYQKSIAATANLPAHMIAELVYVGRPLLVDGKSPNFAEPITATSLSPTDGISFDAMAPGSKFGKTYGLFRTQKEALKVDVADIAAQAKRCIKQGDTIYSLVEINAKAINALCEARLSWNTNVVTHHNVSSGPRP